MKVTELTREQLIFLKQLYIVDLCNDENRPCPLGDISEADKRIPDKVIFDRWKDKFFDETDFI